ncbi:MAG TPA: hypothetical protein VKS81_12020, partial [Bacteroidota bacterium]|nr:hypothetical protein [Bacteroidota bacterium]
MKSKISILVFTFVCLITLRAQTGQNPISVNVRDKGSNESPLRYLNGYRREIEGSTITYHSVHPDAEDALIARVNAEAPSITWETDTMTADFPGNAYRFVWLAGMDRIGWGNATTPHTFHMLLNGTQIFIFHNRKDSTAPHWTITGANGEELTFDARMRDKYGDLFGYMFLSVPKDKYPAGAPLKIRVDGMNEGSPEWYMAFKYSFNFVPSLRVEPALVRNQNAESHLLRMSLDNLRPGRRVEVKVGDSIIVSDSLKLGA